MINKARPSGSAELSAGAEAASVVRMVQTPALWRAVEGQSQEALRQHASSSWSGHSLQRSTKASSL